MFKTITIDIVPIRDRVLDGFMGNIWTSVIYLMLIAADRTKLSWAWWGNEFNPQSELILYSCFQK